MDTHHLWMYEPYIDIYEMIDAIFNVNFTYTRTFLFSWYVYKYYNIFYKIDTTTVKKWIIYYIKRNV